VLGASRVFARRWADFCSQVGDYFALRKFGIASKSKRGKNNQAHMGTIPSETIEQIAAANDIVEVIGSYFPLKRTGANFKALCPFHQEKTPSFIVSPSRQTFHCFGCGAGGSVFRFVMDYEHIDFPAAVHKLGARAGITVVDKVNCVGVCSSCMLRPRNGSTKTSSREKSANRRENISRPVESRGKSRNAGNWVMRLTSGTHSAVGRARGAMRCAI